MAAGTSNTQLNVGEKGFSFFNHGPGKVLPLLAQGGGADTVNALLGLRTEQTQMTFFLIHGKDINNSDAVFLPWNGNHVSVGDARVAFQERFPNLGERFDFVFCQRGNNPDLSIDNAYRQFILPTLEADAKDGGLMYRYETPRY